MNKETALQNAIRLALSKVNVLSFRNNVGAFKNDKGQLIRFGLCKGSSDIIGIQEVTITQDMVGQKIGRFVAIEVKTPGGKPTDNQQKFLDAIRHHGGLAGVAHSEKEACDLAILHMLDTSENPAGEENK